MGAEGTVGVRIPGCVLVHSHLADILLDDGAAVRRHVLYVRVRQLGENLPGHSLHIAQNDDTKYTEDSK